MNQIAVLVHTGTQFPAHINDCITLLKNQHSEVHVIISKGLANYVKDPLIKVIPAEDLENSSINTYSVNGYPSDFKDGFFTRTSSRFLLLHRYAERENLTSFFHIENDVALLTQLQHTKKILEKSSKEMFLIMDNPYRCVPSLLWFRSSDILKKLSKFLLLSCNHTDMENLALFFNSYRHLVGNLPIVDENISNDLDIDFSYQLNDLQLIFDGAALGQYLFGIDDPTGNSMQSIGFINETTVFSPADFNIQRQNNIFYLSKNTRKPHQIANLHMHCKNLKQLL